MLFTSTETRTIRDWGLRRDGHRLDCHTAPEWTTRSVLLHVHRDPNIRTIRDGEPRSATSIFSQLQSYDSTFNQCFLTSTETVRTFRDGEPRSATSIFTQLQSYDNTFNQCFLTSTETVSTFRDGELRSAISIFSQLLIFSQFNVSLRPQRP